VLKQIEANVIKYLYNLITLQTLSNQTTPWSEHIDDDDDDKKNAYGKTIFFLMCHRKHHLSRASLVKQKIKKKKMVSIDQSNIREKKEQHKTPSLFGQTRSPDLSQ
jgi:hypothetical protein